MTLTQVDGIYFPPTTAEQAYVTTPEQHYVTTLTQSVFLDQAYPATLTHLHLA